MLPTKLKRLRASGELSRDAYWSLMREPCLLLGDFHQLLGDGPVVRVVLSRDEVLLELADGVLLSWDVTEQREPSTLLVVDGGYEPLETSALLELSKHANTFVDVGANIGYFSILLASSRPGLRGLAIEPSSDTRKRLVRNVELNSLAGRIRVVASAVGASAGDAPLFKPSDTGNVGASLRNLHEDETGTTETVPVTRLDDLIDPASSSARDILLKIDVEGAEEMVLKGASETLGRTFGALMELSRKWLARFDTTANAVLETMNHQGFNCYAIGSDSSSELSLIPVYEIDSRTIEVNFVFLSREFIAGTTSLPFRIIK